MLSEQDYEEMAKAKRNAEYLAKLDESQEQLKNGQTISFTMEELKAMESENWKPTQKIIDFITRTKNSSCAATTRGIQSNNYWTSNI